MFVTRYTLNGIIICYLMFTQNDKFLVSITKDIISVVGEYKKNYIVNITTIQKYFLIIVKKKFVITSTNKDVFKFLCY